MISFRYSSIYLATWDWCFLLRNYLLMTDIYRRNRYKRCGGTKIVAPPYIPHHCLYFYTLGSGSYSKWIQIFSSRRLCRQEFCFSAERKNQDFKRPGVCVFLWLSLTVSETRFCNSPLGFFVPTPSWTRVKKKSCEFCRVNVDSCFHTF